ncbi:hypothetical protein NHX12_001327 [Muraenolepis orangiensis]|uniref:Axonemal dynein light intermediate polypeptide 1 n=1 Tax=Muraenolepis orangiensis TaxID=630683 RepID=A0A9Q0DZH1_9TELE|nr:hypothetical protein NHX12_001327 [Muraenolepis orangiensis]
MISDLEREKQDLERQVNEQKAKWEAMERRELERQQTEERKHSEEIQFLKRTSQQLKGYRRHLRLGMCASGGSLYLMTTPQKVFVSSVNARTARIECGVPQGSIPGPLLFLIYINDMNSACKFNLFLFADDSALLVSDKDKSQISDLEREKQDLERQVNEQKAKWEAVERRELERRQTEERKHSEEIQFLKRTNELIRQVTINCAERGIQLLRVRDEIRMTVVAYQTLVESSTAFGLRNALQEQQGQADMENRISDLEREKQDLERQVNEQKAKWEAVERRELERQQTEERKHSEEIQFLKRTSQQLKAQLEVTVSPKK